MVQTDRLDRSRNVLSRRSPERLYHNHLGGLAYIFLFDRTIKIQMNWQYELNTSLAERKEEYCIKLTKDLKLQ